MSAMLDRAFEFILEHYIEPVEEGTAEIVKELVRILQDTEYAFVGGLAVSLYYSGARPVSPGDIDIKVPQDEVSKVVELITKNGWKLLRRNQFMDGAWYVFRKGAQNLDLGIAQKPWELEGIKKAKSFVYRGIRIKVLPPEYLIVTKLFAGRGKDFGDVVYLLKSGNVDIRKARALVKKFIPQYLDDFETMREYAKTFDDDEIRRIFEGGL